MIILEQGAGIVRAGTAKGFNLNVTAVCNVYKRNYTEKTVSLNQRNISLIHGERENFFELKKVLLTQKKFFDPKK